MNKPAEKAHVFHLLDILRGVAALAVMAFHFGKAGYLGIEVFPHGYLAVDFFFILSGFVLSFAYQERLDAGWSMRAFLLTRLVRLYPLYFAGMAIGFSFSFVQNHFGKTHVSGTATLLTIIMGLAMVPAFGLEQQSHEAIIYPYNKPAWSLFFEFLANVFHAFIVRRRGMRFLLVVIGISGVMLIYSCRRLGSLDFGVYRKDILFGIARVLYSYTVGLSLYRLWQSGKAKIAISPTLIIGLLLLTFWIPVPTQFVYVYDLLIAMLCFPLLVFAGANSQPGRMFRRNLEWMGIASYAVYVLHMPLANFIQEAIRRVFKREPAALAPWTGIACMILPVITALLLDRFYDAPVRSYLRNKFIKPKKMESSHVSS